MDDNILPTQQTEEQIQHELDRDKALKTTEAFKQAYLLLTDNTVDKPLSDIGAIATFRSSFATLQNACNYNLPDPSIPPSILDVFMDTDLAKTQALIEAAITETEIKLAKATEDLEVLKLSPCQDSDEARHARTADIAQKQATVDHLSAKKAGLTAQVKKIDARIHEIRKKVETPVLEEQGKEEKEAETPSDTGDPDTDLGKPLLNDKDEPSRDE